MKIQGNQGPGKRVLFSLFDPLWLVACRADRYYALRAVDDMFGAFPTIVVFIEEHVLGISFIRVRVLGS